MNLMMISSCDCQFFALMPLKDLQLKEKYYENRAIVSHDRVYETRGSGRFQIQRLQNIQFFEHEA